MKSSRIISITMSEAGALHCQKIEFDELGNSVMVKGENGAGKTSIKNIVSTIVAGAKYLPEYLRTNGLEIVTEYSVSDSIFYMKVKNKKSLTSDLFMLDDKGKKMTPILNGSKITAAEFHKLLSTELSFEADKFINEKTRNEFLFGKKDGSKKGVYSDKLKAVGIIFNEKDPEFIGTIIDRINKAKDIRTISHSNLTANNAHSVALQADDIFNEKSEWISPINYIDISLLDNEIRTSKDELITLNTKKEVTKTKAESSHKVAQNLLLSTLKSERNDLESKLSIAKNNIKNYNDNIDTDFELILSKLKEEIDAHNKKIQLQEDRRTEILSNYEKLEGLQRYFILAFGSHFDYSDLSAKIKNLPGLENKKNYVIEAGKTKKPLQIKAGEELPEAQDAKNLITEFRKCNEAITAKNTRVTAFEPLPFEYIEDETIKNEMTHIQNNISLLETEASEAKDSNKICNRVSAFQDHRESDLIVKNLYTEYNSMLEAVETGVNGLYFKYDDQKKEIELRFSPLKSDSADYFDQKDSKLDLPFDAFSEAERSLITIMMQNYLLTSKAYGVRSLWTEANISKSTYKEVQRLAEMYDLRVFCSFVGDYKAENLQKSEILIQNGELIFSK